MNEMLDSVANTSNNLCAEGLQLSESGYRAALTAFVLRCMKGVQGLLALSTIMKEQKMLERENLLSTEELALLITVYTLLLIFGSCGAVFVIYIVASHPRMRTPRNLFIVNLAISDLTLCLFTQPFNLWRILFWHYDWTLGQVMCKLVSMGQAANIYVSTMSIIAVAIDRLQVIVYSRHTNVGSLGVFAIILCIWFLALLMASPMAAYTKVSYDTIRPKGAVCGDIVLTSGWMRRSKLVHGWFTLAVHYCLPTTVVIYAYLRIWMHIRRKRLIRHGQTCNYETPLNAMTEDPSSIAPTQMITHKATLSIPQIESSNQNKRLHAAEMLESDYLSTMEDYKNEIQSIPEFIPQHGNESEETPQHFSNLKFLSLKRFLFCKTSQKYGKKRIHKRKMRTNALLASMTLNLVLAWLPLHLYSIIVDFRESTTKVFSDTSGSQRNFTKNLLLTDTNTNVLSGRIFTLIHGFALACVLLGAGINPVLYGWLNNNFRKEFKHIFLTTFKDARIFRIPCK